MPGPGSLKLSSLSPIARLPICVAAIGAICAATYPLADDAWRDASTSQETFVAGLCGALAGLLLGAICGLVDAVGRRPILGPMSGTAFAMALLGALIWGACEATWDDDGLGLAALLQFLGSSLAITALALASRARNTAAGVPAGLDLPAWARRRSRTHLGLALACLVLGSTIGGWGWYTVREAKDGWNEISRRERDRYWRQRTNCAAFGYSSPLCSSGRTQLDEITDELNRIGRARLDEQEEVGSAVRIGGLSILALSLPLLGLCAATRRREERSYLELMETPEGDGGGAGAEQA